MSSEEFSARADFRAVFPGLLSGCHMDIESLAKAFGGVIAQFVECCGDLDAETTLPECGSDMLQELVRTIRQKQVPTGDLGKYACSPVLGHDEFKTFDDKVTFQWACTRGHFGFAQWLATHFPAIANDRASFVKAVCNGHLEVAKWLASVFPDIVSPWAFVVTCSAGRLLCAKWLVSVLPNIERDTYNEAFSYACAQGRLHTAQWLSDTFPVDYRIDHDDPFRSACFNGHLEVAKWLKSTCPGVHPSNGHPDGFYHACRNGYVEVAKWLYQEFPGMDLSVAIAHAFGYPDSNIYRWLVTLPGVADRYAMLERYTYPVTFR